MKHVITGSLFALFLIGTTHAADLHLELPGTQRTWHTAELLQHPQAQDIHIEHDVTYKRGMRYRAVPLRALLDGVAPGDHVQVVAEDGFAAEMSAAPLLNERGAVAWLAVEDPANPWPARSAGRPGAGPFYLVWQDPKAGDIGPEQWPFQVATIRTLAPVSERFPVLLPAADASAEVQAGLAQFQKHCLACHRLNAAGDAQFGPDLNIPYNPTEYFAADFLSRYIRNPQQLRRWPEGRMPGFSAAVLSDRDLQHLLAYLTHMAGRKVQVQ